MFFKTVVLLLAVPWLLTDKGVSESNKFYGLFTWLTHMAALNPKPLNPKPQTLNPKPSSCLQAANIRLSQGRGPAVGVS